MFSITSTINEIQIELTKLKYFLLRLFFFIVVKKMSILILVK